MFNSRIEGFEDLPTLPGLGRVVLALHRSPGLALGPWASRVAAGSWESGSPEPGVRCHGDLGGRAGGAADRQGQLPPPAGLSAAGRGALCPGRPRARRPLKCPHESWTRLDTPARSLRAPGSPHLVFSGASALSLPPGRRAQGVPEHLPLHTSTPPRAGLEPGLGDPRLRGLAPGGGGNLRGGGGTAPPGNNLPRSGHNEPWPRKRAP